MENLGNQMVAFRKKKRLSQKDLGELLGITSQQVSNIENGGSTKHTTFVRFKNLESNFENPVPAKQSKKDGANETLDRLIKMNSQMMETIDRLTRMLENQTESLGKPSGVEKLPIAGRETVPTLLLAA